MKTDISKIIYYRESAIQSIIADFFTFLFLGLLFAFNYIYLNDGKVAAFFFFLVFVMYTLSKAKSRQCTFTDKATLQKHIDETL